MNNLKITIVGNSVTLRIRPPEKYPNNKNYTTYLQKELQKYNFINLVEVDNKGFGAFTSYNILKQIDYYIQSFPNFYVLNIGVVDASTREIPLWIYRIVTNPSQRYVYWSMKLIYAIFIKKIRPLLVYIRGKRSWIGERKFRIYISEIIERLKKDTNAKIIVLPINIADKRVEKALPGTIKKQKIYNAIMKEVTNKAGQTFIDLSYLESEKHYPDGVHYSRTGHEIVAKEIANCIVKMVDNK